MKSAYILTNHELVAILGSHLRAQGFDTHGMTLRFTATNAIVAGITKIEPEVFDDEEDEDDEDDGWSEPVTAADSVLRMHILAASSDEPRTVAELASELDAGVTTVSAHVASLCREGVLAAVTPAREDGKTVSAFMRTETEAFEKFVEVEKARVASAIEWWAPLVLEHAPKFYETGIDRESILESVCARVAAKDEEGPEEIRRDCRNVFYGMLEQGLLSHRGHAWKAAMTDRDKQNVEMLAGTLREVFEGTDLDVLEIEEVAAKLPAPVDQGLLRWVLGRRDQIASGLLEG